MKAARARLAAVTRHVIATRWGAVEYAEQGEGEPVLVVHGIFHTCVGGLLCAHDLFTNRRLIAPSRFGYLGSSMPPDATPAAQADAFAALLEALGIATIDVIAVSAGATSALQLALRHPDKVKHLAVLVGQLAGKSHRGRPTMVGEALESPAAHVGAEDTGAIAYGAFGSSGAQRVRDDGRTRSVRRRIHRQPVPSDARRL
jgi:pimeloyl-ACP methyl ester carboxylesterase